VSELAARLVSAGDTGPPRLAPGTAAEVGGLNPALSDAEVGLLAEAVEDAGRVEIDYRSASGALTQRVIAAPQLVGSVLYAWCELRQDERVFTVGRILAVAPAP
jgi:predicted DNA-binding transcriptional regulator YafY